MLHSLVYFCRSRSASAAAPACADRTPSTGPLALLQTQIQCVLLIILSVGGELHLGRQVDKALLAIPTHCVDLQGRTLLKSLQLSSWYVTKRAHCCWWYPRECARTCCQTRPATQQMAQANYDIHERCCQLQLCCVSAVSIKGMCRDLRDWRSNSNFHRESTGVLQRCSKIGMCTSVDCGQT
jgi:hypothetical protein